MKVFLTNNLSKVTQKVTAFKAKSNAVSTDALKPLRCDVVELHCISAQKFPVRLELNDVEKKFEGLLKELRLIEANIKTQKQNLSSFYSYQDKSDYNELLTKRRSIIAKLNRLSKKENVDYTHVSCDIDFKKSYNLYAPKILRAANEKELNDVNNLILSRYFSKPLKNILLELVNERARQLNLI